MARVQAMVKFNNFEGVEVVSERRTNDTPNTSGKRQKSVINKKPLSAYMLWSIAHRPSIKIEHFGGRNVRPQELVKKAAEIWKTVTTEARAPYDALAAEMKANYKPPNSKESVAKKATKAKKQKNQVLDFDNLPEISSERWSKGINGRILFKLANGSKLGEGSFHTFNEAVAAAESFEGQCSGITYNADCKRGGAFTLRKEMKWCNPTMSWYQKNGAVVAGLLGRDCSWVLGDSNNIGWQAPNGYKWE